MVGERWDVKTVMGHLGVSRATVNMLVLRGLLTRHENVVGVGKGGRRVWFDSNEVKKLKVAEKKK